MRYASIPLEVLHSAAFRGAEPVDRATWVCLLAYCYEQESHGRIAGGRAWGDRRCQQILGVTREEIDRYAPGLWLFEGDDLIVEHYDHAYVEKVGQNSRGGVAGGSATSEAKAAAARANGTKGGRPPVPRETDRNENKNPTDNPTPNPTITEIKPTEPKLDGRTDKTDQIDTHPHAVGSGGGGVRIPTKEENTKALEKLLHRLVVSTGPVATPKWAGLAMQCEVINQEEALRCVEWLILKGRENGGVVQYASDVLPHIPAWHAHQKALWRTQRAVAS